MQARLGTGGGGDEICSGRNHFYGWDRGYGKGKLEQKLLSECDYVLKKASR